MSTVEILTVVSVIATLMILRFGIPILLTWALGRMLQRLNHS